MYVEVGWPVRSTQQINIVQTLQASLANQSFTQSYALTGLMNAMSRNYAYYLQKA